MSGVRGPHFFSGLPCGLRINASRPSTSILTTLGLTASISERLPRSKHEKEQEMSRLLLDRLQPMINASFLSKFSCFTACCPLPSQPLVPPYVFYCDPREPTGRNAIPPEQPSRMSASCIVENDQRGTVASGKWTAINNWIPASRS